MKIELKKLDGDEMEFILSGSTPAFANALRRVAANYIPTMAIDEAEIKINGSAMYDEIIAHRLAMVPLRTPVKGYLLPEACGCREGRCTKCSVELALKQDGPGVVLTESLKSSDTEVTSVSNSIPIVSLAKGQNLDLVAIARLGLGKEHARWQSGIIAYKYMPMLEFDPKLCDACGECVKACPKEILEDVDGKIIVKNIALCNMCKSCMEKCPSRAVKASGDPTKFIFKVESSGTLPPEQIILKAITVLQSKLEEFNQLFKRSDF